MNDEAAAWLRYAEENRQTRKRRPLAPELSVFGIARLQVGKCRC